MQCFEAGPRASSAAGRQTMVPVPPQQPWSQRGAALLGLAPNAGRRLGAEGKGGFDLAGTHVLAAPPLPSRRLNRVGGTVAEGHPSARAQPAEGARRLRGPCLTAGTGAAMGGFPWLSMCAVVVVVPQ
eukprot:7232978-Prymnesium_polylepis.1